MKRHSLHFYGRKYSINVNEWVWKLQKHFVFLLSHPWLPPSSSGRDTVLYNSVSFKCSSLLNICGLRIIIYVHFLVLKFYIIMNLIVWKGQILFCFVFVKYQMDVSFPCIFFFFMCLKTGQIDCLCIITLLWEKPERILIFRNFSPKIFKKHMLHLLIAFYIYYTKWTITSIPIGDKA